MNSLSDIISNKPLALAILSSIQTGLDFPIHLAGSTRRNVVQEALDTAIRDINEHSKGQLFQRFIEFGPKEPDVSSKNYLDDTECESCIEFIHSHMVNRFKGELAELLAIEPCANLIGTLRTKGKLADDVECYFGDIVQERRRLREAWMGLTVNGGSACFGSDATNQRLERSAKEQRLLAA